MFAMTAANMATPISAPRPIAAPAPRPATSVGARCSVRRTTQRVDEDREHGRRDTEDQGERARSPAPRRRAWPPTKATAATARSCFNKRMTTPS